MIFKLKTKQDNIRLQFWIIKPIISAYKVCGDFEYLYCLDSPEKNCNIILLAENFIFINFFTVNLSSPRPAKTVPFVILLCLMPDDFTDQWRASRWERVNWAYLTILFLNLSSPRPSQTVPFLILLCLTPDNFTCQWRVSEWERVKVDGSDINPGICLYKNLFPDSWVDITFVTFNSKKVYKDEIFSQQDILQFFSGKSKEYKYSKSPQTV